MYREWCVSLSWNREEGNLLSELELLIQLKDTTTALLFLMKQPDIHAHRYAGLKEEERRIISSLIHIWQRQETQGDSNGN